MTEQYLKPCPSTLTVSQLNRAANRLLAGHFFSVRVEGEVSNLSIPSSGHWYFSLKDSDAQIRCALFKNQQRQQMARPENGQRVTVHGQVGLYEPRGDYQLLADTIEAAGDGALRQAFESLKRKLADEGLFDSTRKKPLPLLPGCIGLITSPTGAAVRDLLTVLKRRFPAISVILYPVAVQGPDAPGAITRAIATANRRRDCNLLIVARGGGSLEDLWAFNEERVARAIDASSLPVIAAIGHETDFTIADFVADSRAPTPSAAAEMASPDQTIWRMRFIELQSRIEHLHQQRHRQCQQTLAWLSSRLQQQHPKQRLLGNAQRLDELETRLQQALKRTLQTSHSRLEIKTARLWLHTPRIRLSRHQQDQTFLRQRLYSAIKLRLQDHRQHFSLLSQTLNAVSPLATLNRGYAVVSAQASGEILRSADQALPHRVINIRWADGQISARVLPYGAVAKAGDG